MRFPFQSFPGSRRADSEMSGYRNCVIGGMIRGTVPTSNIKIYINNLRPSRFTFYRFEWSIERE